MLFGLVFNGGGGFVFGLLEKISGLWKIVRGAEKEGLGVPRLILPFLSAGSSDGSGRG